VSGLFDQIRRLFSREQSPTEGFVREALERSPRELEAYRAWSSNLQPVRAWLGEALVSEPPASLRDAVFLLQTPSTRGFLLRPPCPLLRAGEGAHLFDWLGDRLKALGYYRQHADVRSWLHPQGVERVERRHFKARFRYDEEAGKSVQLYGNVTLEHKLLDGLSTEVRLVNHPYHDRAWHPAGGFDELIQALLHAGEER
jgi:hypothetical protein